MSYKVAIAISGAVSLGSYEAGTIYEIINALKDHNNAEENPDEHIYIDVLTGASAGGMTAALVAQKLLFDADALASAETNAGYQAWVERVDIDGLLTPHPGDNINNSLLSTGFVNAISDELILGRYQDPSPPSKNKHAASDTTIALGLAMANLNGVDYSRDIFASTHEGLDNATFVETRHQDRVSRTLTEADDTSDVWQFISTAARGCGSFPLAFSPIGLFRRFKDHDYEARGADDFSQVFPSGLFSFMDGGTFNNYPLGMARDLAKKRDNDPLDYAKRFYFYISPSKKTSTMDVDLRADSPNLAIHTYAAKLAKAIFTQGRFQDWLQTDKTNTDIELLDKRATQLIAYIESCSDTKCKHIATTSKQLCEALYSTIDTQEDETLDAAIARLTQQYQGDIEDYAAMPSFKQQAWLYSIALFEKAAGLNDRDIMRVYTITADEEQLASEKLFAFLGFLDKRFRHHDYLRGRLNGMKVINHILTQRQHQDRKDNHLPLAIEKRNTQDLENRLKQMNLGNVTIADADIDKRKALYRRVKERYFVFAKNMGMGRMMRQLLFTFFISKKLSEALKIKD